MVQTVTDGRPTESSAAESEGCCGPLHTGGTLAAVLGLPEAVIRHWLRRGILSAARRAGSIAWFDFEQFVVGRRLKCLLSAGMSLRDLERHLARLGDGSAARGARLPGRLVYERGMLANYLGGQLFGPAGQRHLPFVDESLARESPGHPEIEIVSVLPAEPTAGFPSDDGSMAARTLAAVTSSDHRAEDAGKSPGEPSLSADPYDILDLASDLAAEGNLEAACEAMRALLQARPPTAEGVFMLAEMLYRAGDLTAARERFYAAIELDPDHLMARMSLGCLLAELGETELAIAALEGVVEQQPDFADAHWHLATVLEHAGDVPRCRTHLESFIDSAPESPWLTTARERLERLCDD